MAVITIRGQRGSGAAEIGKMLAERLSIGYVDREIIARVARRLKLPREEITQKEMPPSSFLGRIAEVMANTYSVNPAVPDISLPVGQAPLNDTLYLETLEHVIKDIAKSQPIVIRGRGSQFILKDYPETFHVMTVAPLEMRVERVMKEMKADEAAARKEIEQADGARRSFIKRYFKAELEDPAHYDLVINTGHLDTAASVSIIIYALRLKS